MTVTSFSGTRKRTDHVITVDMAKELCMLARSEKGKQARQYFIQIEKDWNSPEKVMARALKIAERTLAQARVEIAELEHQLDEIDVLPTDKSGGFWSVLFPARY